MFPSMRKIAALLALTATALVLGTSASAASKTLTGTVGPGFTITLKSGSAPVKKLAPGSYTIVVQDKSKIHNFHLTGPGVNKSTSVAAVTTVTWKVTLKKGTYNFVCDPHKAFMKGSFTVS
jgi:plastocyanin